MTTKTDITLPPLPGALVDVETEAREYARAAVEANLQDHLRDAAKMVPSDEEIVQLFADVVGNTEDGARFLDLERDHAIRIAHTLLSRYSIGQPAANVIPVPTTKTEYIALLDMAIELGKKLNIAWEDAFRATKGQPAASAEPVAVLRYDHGVPGRENEMPSVVSCNRLPDGDYPVYAAPAAQEPVARVTIYMHQGRRQFSLAELGTKAAGDLGVGAHNLFAAPVATQAQPTMPPLTDAMRAVLRNEHEVYESEDALYAALCDAAQAQSSGNPGELDAQDREDADLLDWLREETCDLRCINEPTGGDDYDVRWIVIRHHMAKPHEREIGRSFTDDPRDAIRAARAAKGEA